MRNVFSQKTTNTQTNNKIRTKTNFAPLWEHCRSSFAEESWQQLLLECWVGGTISSRLPRTSLPRLSGTLMRLMDAKVLKGEGPGSIFSLKSLPAMGELYFAWFSQASMGFSSGYLNLL